MRNNSWEINLNKFKIYLKYKYNVTNAYYFIGNYQKSNKTLYKKIKKSGFILVFKMHTHKMMGSKKGNVDSDIIFSVMKKLYKNEITNNKIILVSGDGDYKMLVDFLIKENKFEKILFPNKNFSSSLYKKLSGKYFAFLDNPDVINKIS